MDSYDGGRCRKLVGKAHPTKEVYHHAISYSNLHPHSDILPNPFRRRTAGHQSLRPAPAQREDAVPGYVELSDGKICAGQVYLTRDARLKINDEKLQRQREVPLSAVKQIDCKVKKEWMEKEWKFKELAKDEKMYTGRSYPSREYVHTITLNDGRTITGELSGIVYVAAARLRHRQAGRIPPRGHNRKIPPSTNATKAKSARI